MIAQLRGTPKPSDSSGLIQGESHGHFSAIKAFRNPSQALAHTSCMLYTSRLMSNEHLDKQDRWNSIAYAIELVSRFSS